MINEEYNSRMRKISRRALLGGVLGVAIVSAGVFYPNKHSQAGRDHANIQQTIGILERDLQSQSVKLPYTDAVISQNYVLANTSPEKTGYLEASLKRAKEAKLSIENSGEFKAFMRTNKIQTGIGGLGLITLLSTLVGSLISQSRLKKQRWGAQ